MKVNSYFMNKYSEDYDILKLHSFCNNTKNFALKNTA